MARPKIEHPSRLRSCWLKIRASDDELAAITRRAVHAGLSVSAYVRAQAIDGHVVQRTPMADKQLVRELAAVGNNLNQIARKVNMTDEVDGLLQAQLSTALGSLEQLIEGLIHDR